jgi:hypothetical protein
LRDFGYTSYFDELFKSEAGEGEAAARVIEEHRDRYRVLREGSGGSPLEEEAQVSRAIRRRTSSPTPMPAVGDRV